MRAHHLREVLVAALDLLGAEISRLVAADLGFEPNVIRDRVDHGPGHESRAGVVEMIPVRAAGRIATPRSDAVEGKGSHGPECTLIARPRAIHHIQIVLIMNAVHAP